MNIVNPIHGGSSVPIAVARNRNLWRDHELKDQYRWTVASWSGIILLRKFSESWYELTQQNDPVSRYMVNLCNCEVEPPPMPDGWVHPFRKTILDQYTVGSDGRIHTPGKFEREPIYVPHFWDIVGEGGHDEEYNEDGRLVSTIDISLDDREAFPEIPGSLRVIHLMEDDQGFVHSW